MREYSQLKQLIAIKIVHDIQNRLIYNLFSEFFRFIGLYIGEGFIDTYTEQEAEEDRKCFQLFLCVFGGMNQEEITNTSITMMDEWVYVKAEDYALSSFDDFALESLKEKMLYVLGDLQRKSKECEKTLQLAVVEKIMDVYLKEKVLKASCQLQYYRMKAHLHKETEEIFQKALNELGEIEAKEEEGRKYLLYARLFCKQKINLACFYQENKPFANSVEKLAEECEQLIKQYTDFSNASVMLGMIYEVSSENVRDAIEAYRDAISKDGEACYASHIYLWIGNLYELYEDYENAGIAYEMAYKLKRKYRNIYKMGRMEKIRGNYQRELEYYEECIKYLENRTEKNMDPLEIEYYYKTGVLICYSYVFREKKYNRAIEYGNRMLEFYNKKLEAGSYFHYFYGDNEGKYKKASMDRINIRKLYECLAVAYRESNDLRKAAFYWGKADELEDKEALSTSVMF